VQAENRLASVKSRLPAEPEAAPAPPSEPKPAPGKVKY